jgi:sec-independent protein translocase protein TatB
MFESIGWGEIAMKRVRAELSNVRGQLDESLGDDFSELRDLDLRRYHPKTFIRDQLFGDETSDRPDVRAGGVADSSASVRQAHGDAAAGLPRPSAESP